jgi:DNA ligase-associated metallophosphoesterase
MVPFSFAGEEWRLGAGRWLFRPRENALLVADLHLEKASFFARHGQMLPPYDSRETLERLALALRETGARRVFCLGDSFHDATGPARMDPHAAGMLAALTRATDWVWITGNHDPALDGAASGSGEIGGTVLGEVESGGIVLRHQARAGEVRPELSGHWHPKVRISLRGRNVARACLVAAENDDPQQPTGGRMILPAFGTLTGGMDAASSEILGAMQPARRVDACVVAGHRLVRLPLWRAAA